MPEDVEQYLDELRAELAVADPAVTQDALYDAEEHLRAEVDASAEPDFDRIREQYGAPREVAAAYLGSDPEDAAPAVAPPSDLVGIVGRYFRVVADRRAYAALLYMLLALPTGIAYFVTVVVGVSLSISFAIFIFGVPFMILFLFVVRVLSLVEGRIVEVLLGVRMPRRPQRGPTGSLLARVKGWLLDRRTWTTVLYLVIKLPLGIAYFVGTVAAVALSLLLLFGPVVQITGGRPFMGDGGQLPVPLMPVVIVLGVLGLVGVLHVATFVGRLHGAYAKVMLVGAPDVPRIGGIGWRRLSPHTTPAAVDATD